jgi:tetratricopeptide (TPR) repeat protein
MDAKFSADEHFQKGQEWLQEQQPGAALEHFRAAYSLQRDNARYRSAYGLCVGLVERRFNKAIELCGSAVKEEFFNPDLYMNLARVHLAFGFKAEGLRYLRRALMIDPANATVQGELRRLGQRRRPVLGFLPRRHLLNRWLGRARGRLGLATDEEGSHDAGAHAANQG